MILALDNALGTTGYAVFKKDKTLVYCDKFKTKFKELIAFSLIDPKELNIKRELINIAIKNIFES